MVLYLGSTYMQASLPHIVGSEELHTSMTGGRSIIVSSIGTLWTVLDYPHCCKMPVLRSSLLF